MITINSSMIKSLLISIQILLVSTAPISEIERDAHATSIVTRLTAKLAETNTSPIAAAREISGNSRPLEYILVRDNGVNSEPELLAVVNSREVMNAFTTDQLPAKFDGLLQPETSNDFGRKLPSTSASRQLVSSTKGGNQRLSSVSQRVDRITSNDGFVATRRPAPRISIRARQTELPQIQVRENSQSSQTRETAPNRISQVKLTEEARSRTEKIQQQRQSTAEQSSNEQTQLKENLNQQKQTADESRSAERDSVQQRQTADESRSNEQDMSQQRRTLNSDSQLKEETLGQQRQTAAETRPSADRDLSQQRQTAEESRPANRDSTQQRQNAEVPRSANRDLNQQRQSLTEETQLKQEKLTQQQQTAESHSADRDLTQQRKNTEESRSNDQDLTQQRQTVAETRSADRDLAQQGQTTEEIRSSDRDLTQQRQRVAEIRPANHDLSQQRQTAAESRPADRDLTQQRQTAAETGSANHDLSQQRQTSVSESNESGNQKPADEDEQEDDRSSGSQTSTLATQEKQKIDDVLIDEPKRESVQASSTLTPSQSEAIIPIRTTAPAQLNDIKGGRSSSVSQGIPIQTQIREEETQRRPSPTISQQRSTESVTHECQSVEQSRQENVAATKGGSAASASVEQSAVKGESLVTGSVSQLILAPNKGGSSVSASADTRVIDNNDGSQTSASRPSTAATKGGSAAASTSAAATKGGSQYLETGSQPAQADTKGGNDVSGSVDNTATATKGGEPVSATVSRPSAAATKGGNSVSASAESVNVKDGSSSVLTSQQRDADQSATKGGNDSSAAAAVTTAGGSSTTLDQQRETSIQVSTEKIEQNQQKIASNDASAVKGLPQPSRLQPGETPRLPLPVQIRKPAETSQVKLAGVKTAQSNTQRSSLNQAVKGHPNQVRTQIDDKPIRGQLPRRIVFNRRPVIPDSRRVLLTTEQPTLPPSQPSQPATEVIVETVTTLSPLSTVATTRARILSPVFRVRALNTQPRQGSSSRRFGLRAVVTEPPSGSTTVEALPTPIAVADPLAVRPITI